MCRAWILWAVAASACGADDLEQLATGVIRKNCLSCHNAQAKMGGLILETRNAAVAKRAVVPGNAAASLLVQKVKEGKMPPANPLPAAEVTLLEKWIEAGAPWTTALASVERKRAGKDWWSLQPLAEASAGASIDSLIDAALRAKGLRANGPADRQTLIRRATFDLTGLPPAPEEVRAFVNDPDPRAYAKLIDRLLDSPAYGERWGRHWMDVIRFGESHGYEQNHLRPNAWQFRDYIIRSFNEDKPFDRFIQEHLAGDQLAHGEPAVEVGTGFLVAGPHDTVGNQAEAAKRQQKADDLDDMINATASAFLGLTVNCARCHDHKFDPIEQRDYYRLAAVFAGTVHAERELATSAEKQRHQALVEPLERERKELMAALARLKKLAEPRMKERQEAIFAGYRPSVDARMTEENFATVPARFLRFHIESTSTGSLAALDEIEVFEGTSNVALASMGTKVRASSVRVADDDKNAYTDQHLIDGKFDRRWFPADNKPVEVVLEFPRMASIHKLAFSRDRMGGFQGRFEGPIPSVYTIEVSTNGKTWKKVASSEGRLPASALKRDQLLLNAVFSAEERSEHENLEVRQQQIQKRLQALPKLPLAYIGKFQQPDEPLYLLKRGNVMDRGDEVMPASLSTLAGLLEGFELKSNAPEQERRLALARWITGSANPLTPRVLANRVWHYHFGRGIAATPSDFGFNGEKPTHPELLDFLARRLQAYGWRLKPLHREIMFSRAYTQSSGNESNNAAIDNESRYLWRFPPQRLQAEAIRDAVLAVAGTLDRTMGGPGFRLYRYTVDNVATYYPLETFTPDTFRRAVYQTAARSVRSELLGQYDCPDSSLPEPRRIVTTTPLQALALLNNSFLLDQAQHFAQRLEREANTTEARMERAFELAFGRKAGDEERRAAMKLIAEHGLAAFARALFNSNEFIYVM